MRRHASRRSLWQAEAPDPARCFAVTTNRSLPFGDVRWLPGEGLVFGSETAGLPTALRDRFGTEQRVRLPMRVAQRSLNLSSAVEVAVFEAWRHIGHDGGS